MSGDNMFLNSLLMPNKINILWYEWLVRVDAVSNMLLYDNIFCIFFFTRPWRCIVVFLSYFLSCFCRSLHISVLEFLRQFFFRFFPYWDSVLGFSKTVFFSIFFRTGIPYWDPPPNFHPLSHTVHQRRHSFHPLHHVFNPLSHAFHPISHIFHPLSHVFHALSHAFHSLEGKMCGVEGEMCGLAGEICNL